MTLPVTCPHLPPPPLQPDGVHDLCPGLEENTTLLKLSLAWNGLEDQGVVRLKRAGQQEERSSCLRVGFFIQSAGVRAGAHVLLARRCGWARCCRPTRASSTWT